MHRTEVRQLENKNILISFLKIRSESVKFKKKAYFYQKKKLKTNEFFIQIQKMKKEKAKRGRNVMS